MPKTVTLPLVGGMANRYGVVGHGGYMDDYAQMWIWPTIGGSISQNDGIGDVTLYRLPQTPNARLYPKEAAGVAAWQNEVSIQMRKLRGELIDSGLVRSEHDGLGLSFSSRSKLNKFLTLEVWNTVTNDIYEKWDPGYTLKKEVYFVPTFYGPKSRLPWTFNVKDDYEVYIDTPKTSIAGVTRIRYNKGVWMALMTYFGFKPKTAVLVWEMLYKLYTEDVTKRMSSDNIFDIIMRKVMNPCAYQGTFPILHYIISVVTLSRLYELTRAQLDLPDWRLDTKYYIEIENVSDEEVKKNMTAISESWSQGQVRTPIGDLPKVQDLKILPIIGEARQVQRTVRGKRLLNKLQPKHEPREEGSVGYNFADFGYGFDDGEWNDEPRLFLTEISKHKDVEDPGNLDWVDLKVLNPTDHEAQISHNRTFGTYHSSSLDTDSAIIISSIYPIEIYTTKPKLYGMKLEQKHWRVNFDTTPDINPVTEASVGTVHFLLNQKSFYGPNYYLVDIDDLLGPDGNTAFYGSEEELQAIVELFKSLEKRKLKAKDRIEKRRLAKAAHDKGMTVDEYATFLMSEKEAEELEEEAEKAKKELVNEDVVKQQKELAEQMAAEEKEETERKKKELEDIYKEVEGSK